MKRILTLIISLILCFCFALALVACNTEPNGTNPPIIGGEAETPKNPDEETTTPDISVVPSDGNEGKPMPTPTERQTIYLWDDDKIPAWRGNLNSNNPADFRPHILTYPAQGEIKGAVLICP
ncbi:MAG: hypothetical protein K2J83_05155, partial [Clostridia bacterium]|nr:hypothetical protein [Clostridia bacterium]